MYDRFLCTFLCMGALRVKTEVRNHLVKGKVVVLPTRDKMVGRSAH